MRYKVLFFCGVLLGFSLSCANSGTRTSLRAKTFALAEAIDARDAESIAGLLPPGRRNAEGVDVFMRRYFNMALADVQSFKIDPSKYISSTDPLTGMAWTDVRATLKDAAKEKAESGTITIRWQFSDGDLWIKLE